MDCIEGLKQLDDNSIDSVVTDPPYELGFMGKKWDKTGIAYNVDMWEECLRVLKPGGHLLAFGGTRTYHRMVCAIEDAGFEIRDFIDWIYGSGFPKSMDISKQIDKKAGAERNIIGKKQVSKDYTRNGLKGDMLVIGNVKATEINITEPATSEAQQWDGWGTALKPAHEPIVVARKPLSEKTVADNVLKWNTGGINIDDCRIPVDPTVDDMLREVTRSKRQSETWEKGSGFKNEKNNLTGVRPEGRFPANVILDEETGKLLDEQSGITKGTGKQTISYHKPSKNNCMSGDNLGHTTIANIGDSGGASRFFYCAKASKKEKGEYNNHPTVKPLSLIKYLIKLITPPEGICLDPFEGSGTHAVACKELGFNYIGFELDTTYCDIINKRIQDRVVSGQ